MSYIVYDPQPIDQKRPAAWGPFVEKADAEEAANVLHPDDESGNAKVLPLRPWK